jgi:hypothetical protein
MRKLLLTSALLAAVPAAAQSVCASDGQAQPVAVLERFLNADCGTCWSDAATAKPGRRELALDWILPGSKGEDAPLATAALPEAPARLQALKRALPTAATSVKTSRRTPAVPLRIAQGQPLADYIGTSIELPRQPGAAGHAWLLLVERLPAGAEGSPVARNLVRNVFELPWRGQALYEARAMQIHEGTRVERLRLVALVHDRAGRLVAAVQNECRPE